MIETKIICTCDRCKSVIPESENMFKVSKSDVPKSNRKPATNSIIYTDGIVYSMHDQYLAHHICESCSKKLFDFMENKI